MNVNVLGEAARFDPVMVNCAVMVFVGTGKAGIVMVIGTT